MPQKPLLRPRARSPATRLRLMCHCAPDGEDLTLIALQVNGQPWSDYKEENNQLVIGGLPEHFTLTIVNEISPAANTALEGLYQSGEALCTQCEAEGFRHITPVSGPSGCAGALYHQNYRR